MIIRRETPQDIDAIYRLTADAFAPLAMSDGSEPDIINGLRDNGALRVSLVAEEDGKIVGHGALSPVTIKGHSNWFGLGPIAVHPERQKQGIGSALMNTLSLSWKRLTRVAVCWSAIPTITDVLGSHRTAR